MAEPSLSDSDDDARPGLYRVMLLNDDETPMEFVVNVLERFFGMDREGATRLMLRVHNEGMAECGVYPYSEADRKAADVQYFARAHRHPLQCAIETIPTPSV